eukprot:TRINITY_DN2234_c0_g1_i2.p1 TRINITY_DN2234_c0_g1~~TRINITY_DN2234_c0_g1_i2.p1  ORF type:complete len:469 (-),score=105.93 TRINITY_DN2234_c0_g1_i2:14-1420(-)
MNFLALPFLACLAIAMAETRSAGIIEVLKDSALRDHMTYILKTVFYSAKYRVYSDLSDVHTLSLLNTEKDESGSSAERMSVNNIRVDNVETKKIGEFTSIKVVDNTVHLSTKDIIAKYRFRFDWRVEIGGVHIFFGNGDSKVACSKLDAQYTPSTPSSSLEVACSITETNINEEAPEKIKDWIVRKMNEETLAELHESIAARAHLLGEYMHTTVDKAEKRIDKHNLLEYKSNIKEVYGVEHEKSLIKLVYLRDLEVYLNGKSHGKIDGYLTDAVVQDPYSVCISTSAMLIPVLFKIYAGLHKFDGKFDMTQRGYTGTVKDLYEIMPELKYTHEGSEKLEVPYKLMHKVITYTNNTMSVPLNFSFIVEGREILFFQMKFTMSYGVDKSKLKVNEFADILSNVTVVSVKSFPVSPRMTAFLIDFGYQFANEIFEQKSFGLGGLTYVPLLKPKKYRADSNNGNDFQLKFKY